MSSDHHLEDDADDQRRMVGQGSPAGVAHAWIRRPDGSYEPATPIGWLEEHNRFASWLLALRGLDHCGRQVTRTDRLLAAGIGLGWLALTVPLVIMLVDALR